MAEKSKGKPKFSMGQVVRCGDYVRGDVKLNFGKIISRSSDHEGRWTLQFWDAGSGDAWEWDYPESDLRPLTRKEKGR